MSLLSQLLDKIGVSKPEQLEPEEKAIFDRYSKVLATEPVTIDSIKTFCLSQIKVIENQCDGVQPLTQIQQGSLHVYLNILKAIEAPLAERESLERHLQQIINS